MSAKEISVAEKEPNEALQVKRSTSEFGDFSARANFFWCYFLFLQNCVESYLPTQKFAKIFPKISSGVVSPVISERKDNASSKS